MRVYVALLTHNLSLITLTCLEHLKRHTKYPYRLIWIDNGSSPEEYAPVAKAIGEHWEDAIYDGFQENKFYAQGTNLGLTVAVYEHSAELVVCLSNDVFVTEGWLKKLVYIMDRSPGYGLISPLTGNISGGANYKRYYRGLCTPDYINSQPPAVYPCKGNVALFCGMIRAEVVKDVGLLREEFFICGNDDDYNDRVRLSGRKTGVALNVYVEHKHSATKNLVFPERAAIKERHKKLLELRRKHRAKTGDYRT